MDLRGLAAFAVKRQLTTLLCNKASIGQLFSPKNYGKNRKWDGTRQIYNAQYTGHPGLMRAISLEPHGRDRLSSVT